MTAARFRDRRDAGRAPRRSRAPPSRPRPAFSTMRSAGSQPRSSPKQAKPTPHKVANLPAFRTLAAQTDRLKRMSHVETALLVAADKQITGNINQIEQHPARRRHQARDAWSRKSPTKAWAGHSCRSARCTSMASPTRLSPRRSREASAHVKELDTLFTAFRHVPLTTPVHGPRYELTSDFGPRDRSVHPSSRLPSRPGFRRALGLDDPRHGAGHGGLGRPPRRLRQYG